MTALWKESLQSLGRIQEEVARLNSKVLQYDRDVHILQKTVVALVSTASSLAEEVGRKMEEFQEWVNYMTP